MKKSIVAVLALLSVLSGCDNTPGACVYKLPTTDEVCTEVGKADCSNDVYNGTWHALVNSDGFASNLTLKCRSLGFGREGGQGLYTR